MCDWYGQLTFGMFPPQCAFNSSPARTYTLDQWMLFEAGERHEWENDQRGSGYFALCDTCNNERGGDWYVPEFQEWAYIGADIVEDVRQHPQRDDIVAVNLTMRRSYPVRFVKQVVLMLLAINPAEFAADHEPLRRFVVGRDAVGLPRGRYRLFLGSIDHPVARHAGCYLPLHVDDNGITGSQPRTFCIRRSATRLRSTSPHERSRRRGYAPRRARLRGAEGCLVEAALQPDAVAARQGRPIAPSQKRRCRPATPSGKRRKKS